MLQSGAMSLYAAVSARLKIMLPAPWHAVRECCTHPTAAPPSPPDTVRTVAEKTTILQLPHSLMPCLQGCAARLQGWPAACQRLRACTGTLVTLAPAAGAPSAAPTARQRACRGAAQPRPIRVPAAHFSRQRISCRSRLRRLALPPSITLSLCPLRHR